MLLFQSTRPHGARRGPSWGSDGRTGFQSTRPHGARLKMIRVGGPIDRFQSTRPHGARRGAPCIRCRPCPVSIHAPARGATEQRRLGRVEFLGFNPRARTGRDMTLAVQGGDGDVSIHAPARGATESQGHARPGQVVSIHAPARGATHGTRAQGRRRINVSIHAPARGATSATRTS